MKSGLIYRIGGIVFTIVFGIVAAPGVGAGLFIACVIAAELADLNDILRSTRVQNDGGTDEQTG
jgi:hypothetical protein